MPLAISTIHLKKHFLVAVPVVRTALLVSLYALSGILLSSVAMAQTFVQGLPTVGNGSAVAAPSQMLIDATQFFVQGQDDMCSAINKACGKLGSSTSYPLGATIDARGFTGNQVCAANHITTMLFQCVPSGSSHGATGGKLLLGNVNLYADGPASGNYTDGTSGIGTPALILPSFFWGIEGISRGASGGGTPGAGTFLSMCTGSGTPVAGCHNSFPVRSFVISGTSVSGGGNPVTMTITLSSSVTQNTNIYPGELAMVKGSGMSTANNNGTYKIQSVTNGTGSGSITVTVPTGTTACTSSCGTLYLGTPILGFASTSVSYNDSSCFPSGCSGFGEHIKDLGFNCQSQDGCMGWQNLYAQEESGADTFLVNNFNFVGADVHHNAQNFGPILNAEIYTGSGNTHCAEGTTGIYIGDKPMRGLNGWTINSPSESQDPPLASACLNVNVPVTPIASVLMDAPNTEVLNGHCEGYVNCVLMGANNDPSGGLGAQGEHVDGIDGPPSGAGTNTVQISGNYPGNSSFVIERIRKHGDSNTIMDNIRGITLTDAFVGTYGWDTKGSAVNILTTNGSIRNRFDSGIRTGTIASGVSANTDLAGQCTVGVTNCPTISLTQSYTSAPICTCSDTSGINACRVQLTLGTPTTLLISGAGSHTIDYICIGRN